MDRQWAQSRGAFESLTSRLERTSASCFTTNPPCAFWRGIALLRQSWITPTLAIALCVPICVAAAETPLPRLVVRKAESSAVNPERLQPLDEYILTEFQDAKRYEVIGGSDLAAMLDNEAQKQLMGCDDQACLAEIAGAMNADLIASTIVGELDGGYLVSLKIISLRDARVLARTSIKTDHGDDQLMSGARLAVRTVTATSNFTDTLPSVSAVPLALWGVSAAALGTGIVFGLKSNAAHRNFNDPTYADVDGAKRDGERDQRIANIAFGTALLSATAGFLTWWFGGERVEVVPEAETSR